MAVNLFPGITFTKKQRSRSYLRVLFGVEDFTPNSVLFFLERKTLLSDSSLLTPPPRKPERQFILIHSHIRGDRGGSMHLNTQHPVKYSCGFNRF